MRRIDDYETLPPVSDPPENLRKKGNDDANILAKKSTSQLIEETNTNLIRALRMNEATNESGYATIQQLGRQRETIAHSIENVNDVRGELHGARQIIRDIRMGVYKDWVLKGLVLFLLLLLDILLFYRKFLQK
ncbi:putative Snare region anchored in the vesicle membrane C terminus [Trypanosoma vivax]|nr:hypothetical protein TRVL_08386 [Trypanosoma vivax]KAH8614109.1 putative Snare region anchored in the vesicle membrane C terminus [Trypanosoma vivax]